MTNGLMGLFLTYRYGRVFHPQVLLHEIIANLVLFEMSNDRETAAGFEELPRDFSWDSCPYNPPFPTLPGVDPNPKPQKEKWRSKCYYACPFDENSTLSLFPQDQCHIWDPIWLLTEQSDTLRQRLGVQPGRKHTVARDLGK